jgi:predicted transcriptional regulator
MATNKRTPIERESDLVKIAGLYFQGKTQADIAKELTITQQQVSYDLKSLQTRWVEAGKELIDAAKGRELAKIDNLEREYWQAYKLSQKEFRSVSAKRNRIAVPEVENGKTVTKTGKITELNVKRENRVGDARYLSGVAWCIERRCKLLGLDAPIKTDNKVEILDPYSEVIKRLRSERNIGIPNLN